MGMTIEEIQQCLKEYHSGFTGYAGNFQEVVDGALDIMHKYQQLQTDYENRLKADMMAMLKELKYDLYHALCHEIHGKEDCPCTNQTTSCLATFRVCDANSAIDKVIQQKIDSIKMN